MHTGNTWPFRKCVIQEYRLCKAVCGLQGRLPRQRRDKTTNLFQHLVKHTVNMGINHRTLEKIAYIRT